VDGSRFIPDFRLAIGGAPVPAELRASVSNVTLVTEAFVSRNARAIRRLQKQGLADPELDAEIAALAISSMVSRTAYAAFVWQDKADFDAVLRTVTRLWLNALRIPTNRKD